MMSDTVMAGRGADTVLGAASGLPSSPHPLNNKSEAPMEEMALVMVSMVSGSGPGLSVENALTPAPGYLA